MDVKKSCRRTGPGIGIRLKTLVDWYSRFQLAILSHSIEQTSKIYRQKIDLYDGNNLDSFQSESFERIISEIIFTKMTYENEKMVNDSRKLGKTVAVGRKPQQTIIGL